MVSVQEREQLKSAYPSKKWSEKVDKMSNGQLVAVMMRLKNTKEKK